MGISCLAFGKVKQIFRYDLAGYFVLHMNKSFAYNSDLLNAPTAGPTDGRTMTMRAAANTAERFRCNRDGSEFRANF